MSKKLILPAGGWKPRPYQQKLWNALEGGCKRAIAVWHRRAGKDEIALNFAATQAMTRPGNYWHCLPLYSAARKAIWQSVNPHTGRRRIDEAFPKEIRESINETEMHIKFVNGSTWSVIGSNSYDALVGAAPKGIVWSEFGRANPASWSYLLPILVENNGWALIISTPYGRNALHSMLQMARNKSDWYTEVSTVRDTGAISLEAVEDQRLEYQALFGQDVGDSLIEQEYFCSFEAAVLGAYWGKELGQIEAAGKSITRSRLIAHSRYIRAGIWGLTIRAPSGSSRLETVASIFAIFTKTPAVTGLAITPIGSPTRATAAALTGFLMTRGLAILAPAVPASKPCSLSAGSRVWCPRKV